MPRSLSRRRFLTRSAALGGSLLIPQLSRSAETNQKKQAHIAITLDLEMSRNFPKWEDTRWDYEKGNLDEATKQYALGVARRVKARGGVVHFFLVGRVLEQENVDWLKEIIQMGHSMGNHTYDHVNVKATKLADIQPRFQRSPWLVAGKEPLDVIRENIRLTSVAMKERLGIEPSGFRTPGGFSSGLADRPDVRQMLLGLGFKWVSGKYPSHLVSKPGEEVKPEVFESILKAQPAAQPFVYPDGLIEAPMNPISDIGAFRTGRWKLESLLKAVRLGVEWAIENGAVYDFLCHPSCIGVVDPEFRTVDLICDLVQKAGDRAALVNLETVARRVASP